MQRSSNSEQPIVSDLVKPKEVKIALSSIKFDKDQD